MTLYLYTFGFRATEEEIQCKTFIYKMSNDWGTVFIIKPFQKICFSKILDLSKHCFAFSQVS